MDNAKHLTKNARVLLQDGAIKNDISEQDFCCQLISWLADELLKAKFYIRNKFSPNEIAVTRKVFSSLKCSLLLPPDVEELTAQLPHEFKYMKNLYTELSDIEILYFILSSPKENDDGIRYISPTEFGMLMTPPKTASSVLNYIRQGIIHGAKRNETGTRWMLPMSEIESTEKRVIEIDQRRRDLTEGGHGIVR